MQVKDHCRRCTRCGELLRTVEVHGHVQCLTCGQNIDDCCQGETANCTVNIQGVSSDPEEAAINKAGSLF